MAQSNIICVYIQILFSWSHVWALAVALLFLHFHMADFLSDQVTKASAITSSLVLWPCYNGTANTRHAQCCTQKILQVKHLREANWSWQSKQKFLIFSELLHASRLMKDSLVPSVLLMKLVNIWFIMDCPNNFIFSHVSSVAQGMKGWKVWCHK